jgi:NDP-sugar pyrophosphorylase family protein
MKAVILAGGLGTRLMPYTAVLPKPLMPIGDRPIIEIVIKRLAESGIKDISIATGHLAELITTFLGNGEKYGVSIDYSREETPLGTAGPLKLVKGLDETFLVTNGDVLSDIDYADMLKFHKESKAAATVALAKRDVSIDLGVIETENGNVKKYTEKPTLSYNVSTGIYIFEPEVLEHVKPNQRMDLPDLIRALMEAGRTVKAYNKDIYWIDIGRRDDYERANRDFQEGKF